MVFFISFCFLDKGKYGTHIYIKTFSQCYAYHVHVDLYNQLSKAILTDSYEWNIPEEVAASHLEH